MARKTEEDQDVEQQDEEDQDLDEEQGGTSINITDEVITIEVSRDGNEGETLTRLAKLVDGLGE
ncbi:MAG TPA: hypothetical protein VFY04_05860 [Solirubrobacterales bacterium]|nr:hypothetical protein [Solirubrobacterales bacterium]